MTGPGVARSQQDIMMRLTQVGTGVADFFDVRTAELIHYLEYDNAKPFLKPEVGPQDWTPGTDPMNDATNYLDFAIGKCVDHRGLSAARSIDHFKEWAWLSGDDLFMAAIELGHAQYGAPILHGVARAIGAEKIWDSRLTLELERMSFGLPCTPDCHEGCG